MKLPIYHRINDNELQKVGNLDFSEVGAKHTLHADAEKVIGTIHTAYTGRPHPRYFILPKGSTTTFELKADQHIYIRCDHSFQCEGQHSSRGPYEVVECEANQEVWISGKEHPVYSRMKETMEVPHAKT